MFQSIKSKGPSGVGMGREDARPRGGRPSASPGWTTTRPGQGDCPLILPPQPLPALSADGLSLLWSEVKLPTLHLPGKSSLLCRGSFCTVSSSGSSLSQNRSCAFVSGVWAQSLCDREPAHSARTGKTLGAHRVAACPPTPEKIPAAEWLKTNQGFCWKLMKMLFGQPNGNAFHCSP